MVLKKNRDIIIYGKLVGEKEITREIHVSNYNDPTQIY